MDSYAQVHYISSHQFSSHQMTTQCSESVHTELSMSHLLLLTPNTEITVTLSVTKETMSSENQGSHYFIENISA